MKINFIHCDKFLSGIKLLASDMHFEISNDAKFSLTYVESSDDMLKVNVTGDKAVLAYLRGL